MNKIRVILFGLTVACCNASYAQTPSADAELRAIYNDEWKWRLQQFPGLEGVAKPVPDRLLKVDPATQEARLHYW